MENTEGQKLKEELFNDKKTGWEGMSEEIRSAVFKFADEYMDYLNSSKTEKEIVKTSKDIFIKNGFVDLNEKQDLKAGDKVFLVNRDRTIFSAIIGQETLENGIRMIAAHGDSPRIDLKPNPLYEDSGLGLFKTHYYGGIKKYQWTNIPLSMHGTFVKSNGEKIEITMGEKEEDPIFTISDLLPHLAAQQMDRKLKEGVQGEELNIVAGSIPFEDEKVSEAIKLNILKLLNDTYGIKEIDFTSSEIEFVPAFKAKSLGFDRSMVAGYGQDDKVCCYTALRGILDIGTPKNTAVCVLTDKEEIGFCGVTGMESKTFEYFITELLNKSGQNKPNALEKVFHNSKVISADVDGAFDPSFPSSFDKTNSCFIGKGPTIVKYTGSRGKSGASEAPAEFVAEVRGIFEKNSVVYQSSELGKVDLGGGGTIAVVLANRGMSVIDCGVPVLSMHSPYEITSKFDVYQAYKAYEAFYKG